MYEKSRAIKVMEALNNYITGYVIFVGLSLFFITREVPKYDSYLEETKYVTTHPYITAGINVLIASIFVYFAGKFIINIAYDIQVTKETNLTLVAQNEKLIGILANSSSGNSISEVKQPLVVSVGKNLVNNEEIQTEKTLLSADRFLEEIYMLLSADNSNEAITAVLEQDQMANYPKLVQDLKSIKFKSYIFESDRDLDVKQLISMLKNEITKKV